MRRQDLERVKRDRMARTEVNAHRQAEMAEPLRAWPDADSTRGSCFSPRY